MPSAPCRHSSIVALAYILEGNACRLRLFFQRLGFGEHGGKFLGVLGGLGSNTLVRLEPDVGGRISGRLLTEPPYFAFSRGFFGS